MVVLELEGHTNMLGSGPNQYLQPDYLSPLASPLDSKVSPLALLAQTCSQIGSDSHSSESMFDASKRKLSTCSESSLKSDSSSNDSTSNSKEIYTNNNKESRGSSSSSNNQVNNNNRPKSGSYSVSPLAKSSRGGGSGGGERKSSPGLISPNGMSPAFKPYEMSSKPSVKENGRMESERSSEKHLKATKHNLISRSANVSPKVKTPNSRSTPEHSSSSKEISVTDTKRESGSSKPASGSGSSSSTAPETRKSSSSSDHGASPIIRSGLEVLQQGQFGSPSAIAEYNRKLSALSSLSALGGGYPHAGFDPMNPAFRPPFMGPPHPYHAMGYPIPGGSPYVNYSRVKTASGAETIVPVCKDRYCTGCQYGGGGVPHGGSGAAGHLSAQAGAAAAASTMNGLMAAASGYPTSLTGGIPVSGATSNSSLGGMICPAGCVSCDHPKLPLSSLSHLFPPGLASSIASGGYPSASLLSQHVAAASQAQQNAQRPYVCNWIVG